MNPRVKHVEPAPDYKLNLIFQNGERKTYDCSDLLDFGVFKELRDVNYFRQVKCDGITVFWPHEQDICPDTLYIDSK
jgi:hypothetical protein